MWNFIEKYNSTSKELKFIHITKTAGTSIEDVAFKKNILYGRYHQEYFTPNIKCNTESCKFIKTKCKPYCCDVKIKF